ncbi:MAG: KH domain-containing protein [Myxococcota bacterium]
MIGKKGRTAKALRTLLAAVAARQNAAVTLEIMEPSREPRPAGEEPGTSVEGEDHA